MYLGNQPALNYTSFAKQDFTTSATTSYTLDHSVTNENEIALFINFVRQEPGTAYTASNTNLTLSSATSATDDMYCIFLGKAVQTVNPPSGSVGTSQLADSSVSLAKLSATGTPSSSTFLRGDNSWQSAGGENTPYFYATLSADQTGLTNDTETKLTLATEIFDTGSEFDNATNYRFTPANGNTYLVSGLVQFKASAAAVLQEARLQFKKNGSTIVEIHQNTYNNNSTQMAPTFQYIITGNGSDYYELFGRAYVSSGTPTIGQRSFFTAFKLIG